MLRRVHHEHGAAATITEVNRVRAGGFAGFFAREEFEVVVEDDQAGAGPQRRRTDHGPADDGWSAEDWTVDGETTDGWADEGWADEGWVRDAGDVDDPVDRWLADDGRPSAGAARPSSLRADGRFQQLLEEALREREEVEDLANVRARRRASDSLTAGPDHDTDPGRGYHVEHPYDRERPLDLTDRSSDDGAIDDDFDGDIDLDFGAGAELDPDVAAGDEAGPGDGGDRGAGDGAGGPADDQAQLNRTGQRVEIAARLPVDPPSRRPVPLLGPPPTPGPGATVDQVTVAEQPVAEQPVVAQPVVEQPVVAQPAVEQPVVAQPAVERREIGDPFWVGLDSARHLVAPVVVAQPPIVGVVGPLRSIVPIVRRLERHDEGPGRRSVTVLTHRAEIISQPSWCLVRDGVRLANAIPSSPTPLVLAIDLDRDGGCEGPGDLPIWVTPLLARLYRNGMDLVRIALSAPPEARVLAELERSFDGRVLFDLLAALEPARVLQLLEAGMPIGSVAGVPVTAELVVSLRHEAGRG